MNIPILYQMPTLVIGLIFVGILLLALEAGYRIGCWRGRATTESDRKEQWDLVLTVREDYSEFGITSHTIVHV